METDTTAKQRMSNDVFKLIQPDLLSVDDLVIILKEKGVRPGLLSHNKEKLVALFRRVALPLPQRDLQDNYRGRLLMKLRKRFERKKIGKIESAGNDLTSFRIGVTGNSTLSKGEHKEKCIGDRLKPPLDQINYERKKIRLNSGSNTSEAHKNSSSSDLDKIVIKRRKTSDSSTELLSETNFTKEGNSEQISKNLTETSMSSLSVKEVCNGDKIKTVPKKVSLKRNHLLSKTSSSTSDIISDKDMSESDTKRKPTTITWP